MRAGGVESRGASRPRGSQYVVRRSVTLEVVAVSDSDETERFETQGVSSELVEAAGPWAYGEKKTAIEQMLKLRAYGSGIVDTEAVIESLREQLEGTISAFKRMEHEFSNIPSVAERIKEERIALTHEVARANHELRREVEAVEQSGPEERVDEDKLEWLEQETILNGEHVWPEHGKVQQAVPDGVSGEQVIALLKERNPDVPDERFEEKRVRAGGR